MRPRDKIQKRGKDALELSELFALTIGSGARGKSVGKLAKEVEVVVKKLVGENGVEVEDLLKIKGIGEAKACAIVGGVEIGRRLYDPEYKERRKILNSGDAAGMFKGISSKDREYLQVIYLNARYELIDRETVSIGNLDQVSMRPREILVGALKRNAFGIIVGHNHPSGDPTPSKEDVIATRKLKEACKVVCINLVDHLVIAGSRWESVKG